MNENKIPLSISGTDKTQIMQSVNTLATLLEPMSIALDAGDRKRLAKISDGGIAFMQKVAQSVELNPEFFPAYVDAAEFKCAVD